MVDCCWCVSDDDDVLWIVDVCFYQKWNVVYDYGVGVGGQSCVELVL